MTLKMDPRDYDWSRISLDHVHLRVSDLQASRAFYATVLEPLGHPLLLDLPHMLAFHAAGVAAGYTDNGAPGPREYGPYAAYLIDPDSFDPHKD